jgi:hypothetical protein
MNSWQMIQEQPVTRFDIHSETTTGTSKLISGERHVGFNKSSFSEFLSSDLVIQEFDLDNQSSHEKSTFK